MNGSEVARLEHAAALDPANADGWFRLGLAQLDAGMLEAAEGSFRRVLRVDARHAKAGINLGMVLQFSGRCDEAESCYRGALAVAPDLAQGWFNLGTNLMARGRARGAVEALRRATALEPGVGAWHAALASALAAARQAPQARESACTAIRIEPQLTLGHEQLAASLLRLGDPAAAVAACRSATDLGLDSQFLQSCALDALSFLPDSTQARIFEAHRAWGARLAGLAAAWAPDTVADSERALRIGFLCPDFTDEAVACGLQPFLAWHDPAAYALFCYSDVEAEDVVSWRLRAKNVTWANTSALGDDELAARIRKDAIDILVDLGGHRSGGRRMPLLARKPAPIQAAWLAYPGTTGLPSVDYRIVGWRDVPAGDQALFTEQIVRLPAAELCFKPDRWTTGGAPKDRTSQAPAVFGAVHELESLTPQTLSLWLRVLERVPGSILLLATPEGALEYLGARLAAAGIASRRVELVTRGARQASQSLYERIDVGLDAFPRARVSNLLHSLWMGVPMVTLRGATVAANSRASVLEELGLEELVAANEEAYAAIAAGLALGRARSTRWRQELRGRLENSALLDAEGFARALESAFRSMWRRYCARERPAPIQIEARTRARCARPAPVARRAGRERPACRAVVDGVFFQDHGTGIARVWRSLLEEWVRSGFARQLVLLDRDGSAPRIEGVRRRLVARHSYDRLAEDRAMLQLACDEERATVFVSTYYSRPLSTPCVMLAYDMIPEVFGADLRAPEWREKSDCIVNASRFVAISASTARDLSDFYPSIDPARITVAYCGVAPVFRPCEAAEIEGFRRRHAIRNPYYLLVGGRRGYKNARTFFRAFSMLPDRMRRAVLWVGGEHALDAEEQAICAGCEVHLLRLVDEDLRLAYGGAIALAFPSAYEGFGMPVAEAMACGCPVVTTSSASLPEVAGAAALTVSPTDAEALAEALMRVQSPAVREDLIRRGFVQARRFSWTRMAEAVASVLAEFH
jgi:predicted O-linked N-acetylglucosamine transferase (SPINDLY family)/glycosyltransferase involved in cell wall biosynthesis